MFTATKYFRPTVTLLKMINQCDPLIKKPSTRKRFYLFIYYLLCHIYPGVPHQCATLFSLWLLHYIHDNTNTNQYTFSYNTVITWYMYMLTTYSYTCFSLNIMMVTWPLCRFIEMLTTYNYLIHVWSTYAYLPRM